MRRPVLTVVLLVAGCGGWHPKPVWKGVLSIDRDGVDVPLEKPFASSLMNVAVCVEKDTSGTAETGGLRAVWIIDGEQVETAAGYEVHHAGSDVEGVYVCRYVRFREDGGWPRRRKVTSVRVFTEVPRTGVSAYVAAFTGA